MNAPATGALLTAPFDPSAPDPIAEGDIAAGNGDWPLAISTWEGALHSPQRDQAVNRLQWFLRRTETSANGASYRKPLLLSSVGFVLLGTAIVFIAQSSSGTLADVLAIGAWACYVAAAVGTVTYAWQSGTTSQTPDLDAATLRRARNRAHALVGNAESGGSDVRR